MKQIHFFALRDDMLPMLAVAEQSCSLKYVRTGQFTGPDFKPYECGADIPNIGMAATESASSGESFLVSHRETPVNIRRVGLVSGRESYLIDQLVNPDTIILDPGGVWGVDFLISGRIATVSDTAPAQELMKRFSSAIRKSFKKIRAFYVGEHAQGFLDAGARLTASARSPREYDLIRPEPQE